MKLSTKINKQIIMLIAFSFSGLVSFGQAGENLVPNGSFEELSKKPKKLGKIELATGWTSPTGARADLFSDASNVEDCSAPMNMYGKETAKEGGNYAGIVAYSYGNKVPRTYIMSKLDAPLKKGLSYCIKFNVSLSEASKYATNNMGITLSKRQFGTDSKVSIIEEPSLMHFNNDLKIMSARYNWTEICGVFVAEGGEKYLTIGNFISDDDTKSERMKKDNEVKVAQIAAAYYYIDDISIRLIDTERGETCDCAAEEAGNEYSKTVYQKTVNLTEDMTPAEQIEAHQIFFAFGRDKLTSEGEQSLDKIAEIMMANPELKLQINGHCNAMEDEVGMENDYYADMDTKRIGTVMTYLKEKGVDSSRLMMSQKGSESSNPDIREEDDEDLRLAKDRRVTFKVR